MPPIYLTNGTVRINDASEITLRTSFNDNDVGLVMPAERSIDVNGLEDFACAELLLEAQREVR